MISMININIFDVVVIGSGPAGCTASLYTSRANLKTIQFEGTTPGGQLITTSIVENFPGFPDGIDGFELTERMRNQTKKFGTILIPDTVIEVKQKDRNFIVYTDKGECETKSIIIASGSNAKKLTFPGSEKFWHKGISACAVCDGALPMFRNKPLAVIGGGDTAMEEALWLSKYGSIVYIVHRRGEFRASKIMQKRVFENPKISILWNSEVVEAKSGKDNKFLEKIIIKNVKEEEVEINCNGLFFAIGHEPASSFVSKLVEMDKNGYIKTGFYSYPTGTSIPGIFACGDVQDHRYRQAITASGSGCQSAMDVNEYL